MASQYESWNQHDSDEEEDPEDEYYNSKEAVLFLLEATPTMLAPMLPSPAAEPTPTPTPTPGGGGTIQSLGGWTTAPRSKMEVALRAAYAMMKRKVISAPKDSLGIIVFNTKETSGNGDTKTNHCYHLLDLAQPDARNIREFKQLLQKVEKDPDHLARLFEPNTTDKHAIADAFGACNNLFRARAPKQASKRIFFVTDNDDPVEGSVQLTTVARNKRQDLTDMHFDLEPFLIPARPDEQFDLTKFYDEVLAGGDDDDDVQTAPPPIAGGDLADALERMISAIRAKESIKRTAFSIPFVLGEGLVIGINGYQLVGEEKKKQPVKVDLDTAGGDEVISKTIYKDAETMDVIDPKKEIKKYFQVGKSNLELGVEATKVFFEESEIRKIKTLGEKPSLKLLGFKPRAQYLRFHETVKHSYFLHPNEEMYSGSTRTFASLLKSMVKKDLVGFAVLIARTTARPQIAILIPQEERQNEHGIVSVHGGIHVCQLPFKDDIRPLGIESTASAVSPDKLDDNGEMDMSAVDTASKVVKYLTKAYNPDEFPNPALNYFYESLAAIALDEDAPNQEDQTIPKYTVINTRVGKYLKKLKEIIPENAVDSSKMVLSKKRRAVDKPEVEVDTASVAEFAKSFFAAGSKGLTIDKLKAGLRAMGSKTSGKKDELIERIRDDLARLGHTEGNMADSDDEAPKPKKGKKVKKEKKAQASFEEDEDFPTKDTGPPMPMGDDDPPTEDDEPAPPVKLSKKRRVARESDDD